MITLQGNFRKITNLGYSKKIPNTDTKTSYSLVATINIPSINHFSCSLIDPNFCGNSHTGFWNHDSLLNDSQVMKVLSFDMVASQRPQILFNNRED